MTVARRYPLPTLKQRVDEILFYVWDPLGFAPKTEHRTEYETYVPGILSMVEKDADAKALAKRLKEIVRTQMGRTGFAESSDKAGEMLVAWRDQFADMARKKAGIPAYNWTGSLGIRRAEAFGPFASTLLVKIQGTTMRTNIEAVNEIVLNALKDAKKVGLSVSHAVVFAVARGGDDEEWGAAEWQGKKLGWSLHRDPRVLMKRLGISVKARHVAIKLAERPIAPEKKKA